MDEGNYNKNYNKIEIEYLTKLTYFFFFFYFPFDFSTVTIAKGIVHPENSYKHAKHDVFTSSNPIFYDHTSARVFNEN